MITTLRIGDITFMTQPKVAAKLKAGWCRHHGWGRLGGWHRLYGHLLVGAVLNNYGLITDRLIRQGADVGAEDARAQNG